MIDRVRYVLCVASVVVLPAGLLFWFIIHPLARFWRRLGPGRTFLIVLPVISAAGVILFRVRRLLVGIDLGMNWYLIAVAGGLYVLTTMLECKYWKHLSIPIAAGIPELSTARDSQGKLLQEGIYRVVRHPRYLSAGLGVIGNSLFINYTGLYLLILVVFPLGFLMLRLEEAELIERFGDEYRRYQREVPQILPRFRKRV